MKSYTNRKYIIGGLFIAIALIYNIKLFNLQVVETSYKKWATDNAVRELTQYPTRGLIYDRSGELLVHNEAAYDLMVKPIDVKAFDTTLLCELANVEKEDLIRRMNKARRYSRYKSSVAVSQISSKQFALLQEQMYKFPGFFPQTRQLRKYPHDIAGHVFGYLSLTTRNDIKKDPYYDQNDFIGHSGIEKIYEEQLRGKKGKKFVLVDSKNRTKGSYNDGELDEASVRGKDITSTLDWELQQYGEALMKDKAGSIVAIEPSTGEILSLVSTPGFASSDMVGRQRNINYPRLYSDTLKPLFNRALMAQYPPGSTFKMANALIGLQEGIITEHTRYKCIHGYTAGNFHMGCHHNWPIDLDESIAKSCNAYYAELFRDIVENPKFGGVKRGYDAWRNHIVSFGFGEKLDTDFQQELPGLIPTTDWFDRWEFKGYGWRALQIISIAIGQGQIMTTPLQMANYAAAIANRGYYYIPHVVKDIKGESIDQRFKMKQHTSIDSIHFTKILDGMREVMEYEGTAVNAKIPGIEMCGKTGTVENPHGIDHSSFIAFAPADDPKIAIAVYVEKGKWGNRYAAPIASLIVEKYLTDTIQPKRKSLETKMLNSNLLYPDKENYSIRPEDY